MSSPVPSEVMDLIEQMSIWYSFFTLLGALFYLGFKMIKEKNTLKRRLRLYTFLLYCFFFMVPLLDILVSYTLLGDFPEVIEIIGVRDYGLDVDLIGVSSLMATNMGLLLCLYTSYAVGSNKWVYFINIPHGIIAIFLMIYLPSFIFGQPEILFQFYRYLILTEGILALLFLMGIGIKHRSGEILGIVLGSSMILFSILIPRTAFSSILIILHSSILSFLPFLTRSKEELMIVEGQESQKKEPLTSFWDALEKGGS
jgi:hypothetical protein